MPRSRLVLAIVAVAAAVLTAALLRRAGDDPDRAGVVAGAVVRVVDGDTIRVRVGGRTERVRYIGVDTPEEASGRQPVECFAEAARSFNSGLVDGRRVRLVGDAERRDRYGRLLAYVYREDDDLFVNAELVRRGYAQTLTIAPNVRHASRFAALARRARAADAGLWGAC